MILSVSRRTDVPNYYADWFLHRVKEGFLYVRNPMNAHQISKIALRRLFHLGGPWKVQRGRACPVPLRAANRQQTQL